MNRGLKCHLMRHTAAQADVSLHCHSAAAWRGITDRLERTRVIRTRSGQNRSCPLPVRRLSFARRRASFTDTGTELPMHVE